ncbi:hypothetical protein PBI_DRMANHATTAN_65 [Arthrobacter phage DrManhattan]|uniref:DUF7246 domain-containing protein n=2 Tax=Manhattanvirus drmanhattan TaxID=2734250 RepID=A0A3G2KFM2_9CAUD|nr:hypothetical protein HOU48_gp65 [Arthrobacter phage DrManhattan]AYN57783.1 hypothetical protein PBI_DRMANHATTAN_65 [Arthrobacter phage DrManhattan]QHB36646.1 hypothetical protein SEA_ADOLIN_64 [Arthrobacter phage Adolin]
MPRKKSKLNLPADWHEHDNAEANGRHITPGTEVSIRGERGRFRFLKRVTRDDGREWLDFWGGPKGCEAWRSFSADQIRRVHRINTTEKALAAQHKAKKEALRAA